MNLSIGEYRALVAKALRGAGYPWGLTEDGAYAAGRLATLGLDDGSMVVHLLEAVDGRPMHTLMPGFGAGPDPDPICPICAGTALADLGHRGPIELPSMIEPLLALPLAAPDELPAVADTDRRTRVELTPDVAAALERFAHRTYAPATDASRISGAGAGLIDDD